MSFWKRTSLQNVNATLFVTSVAGVGLLLCKHFLLGSIMLIMAVGLCPVWFRLLGEELVVALLKRYDGQCTYDDLLDEYPAKILSALSRLERKGIVDINEQVIRLREPSRVCTFDKQRNTKDANQNNLGLP